MSLTQFHCQYCGRTQSVPSSRNGQSILCRNCGGDNVVPGTPPPAAAPEPEYFGEPIHEADAEHTTCPYCGEVIKAAAIKCRHCGERLGSGRQPAQGGFGPKVVNGNLQFGPQAFGGPQGFGGQGFVPPGMAPPDLTSAANASILLAILGMFFCWGLPAPFALMKANQAKALAARYQVAVPTQATIAAILAWLSICGWVLMIGLIVIGVAAG